MLQTRNGAAAAAVIVSAGWPGLSMAETLHVPTDYPTIQACIDAAVTGVDECVVAPGTYHETINFLGKAITLRSSGGADVTTIDATGIGGSVVTCASGEGADTVLDGFTITGGTGTGVEGQAHGGGMYNGNSSPMVTNCTFRGNRANDGGGMYNSGGSPTVAACNFDMNVSIVGSGGGMSNYANSPTVTNCRFNRNRGAQGDGGGMYNFDSNPIVTNCTFIANTVSYAGGAMLNWRSTSTVTNCTFSGNLGASGGGMYNIASSPTVTNCRFNRNAAFEGNGGGMTNSDSNPTVANCAFIGNTGTWHGGGMVNYGGSPFVTHCTFSGNTAPISGGGMYNYKYLNDGTPTVTNCVLWSDSPDEIVNANASTPMLRFSDVQGGLPVGAVDGGGNINLDPIFVRPPHPGPDGIWDGVDDVYGDLRLQAGSPCINAGDPGFVPQAGETDLDGHARVLCGRVDMGAYEFGIGDYDCDQTVDLIDFANWAACMTGPRLSHEATQPRSHEGTIQNRQSAIGKWQLAIPCEAFDFDGDGDVDFRDFAAWQNAFTGE